MYLFFDTETNGLPKNFKAPPSTGDNWPRIIQLAYASYDKQGKCIGEFVSLISPDGWEIPVQDFWIQHGYSTEKNAAEGKPFIDVGRRFCQFINLSEIMIAHNLDFDYPVVASEFMRYGIRAQSRPKKFCTMKSTTAYCQMPGKFGFKWPKLEELHERLFDCSFDGAHDALADVRATARCFFELLERDIISP